MVGAQLDPVRLSRLNHAVGLLYVQGHGLLHQDMAASLYGLDSEGGMGRWRGQNVDHIGVRSLEHCFQVTVSLGAAGQAGDLSGSPGVLITNRDDFEALDLLQGADVRP